MKNVFTPLAKSAFLPLGLTAPVSATDAKKKKENFSKKSFCIRYDNINNFKSRNGWYYKNN